MNKHITTTGSIIALALAGVLLTGCGAKSTTVGEEPAAAASQEAEPEAAPEPEVGTLANPAAVGSTVTIESYDNSTYEVSFPAVNLAANEAVAEGNMFNDAAPAGQHWVVVSLAVKNTSADATAAVRPGSLAFELTVTDQSGASYQPEMAVLTNSLSGMNEIFTGQTATGDVPFLVPDSATSLVAGLGGTFVTLG